MTESTDKLLSGLGARGILTILGVRKTIASGDMVLPEKETLIKNFNNPIIGQTEGWIEHLLFYRREIKENISWKINCGSKGSYETCS